MKVGIVGLGLMGGSLARDLAAAGWTVVGSDLDAAAMDAAVDAGILGPWDPAVDLAVLAVPVGAVGEWLPRLAGELGPETVVTDLGSTKRSVVEAAAAAGLASRFVGSHPVAGHHQSGWDAGHRGLYQQATVWLCPAPGASSHAVDRVEALWRQVGAEPRITEARAHDRLLARVSHVPQILATVLATALARDGVGMDALGPGGRDMTRLAGSHPTMWTDILVDNADEVELALEAVEEQLGRVARALREADDATLRSILAAGNAWSRGRDDTDLHGEVAGDL